MTNMIIYAEYRNSYAEIIGVIDENLYDVIYPQIEKWALDNGFDRVTEAVIEDEDQAKTAIAEINRYKSSE